MNKVSSTLQTITSLKKEIHLAHSRHLVMTDCLLNAHSAQILPMASLHTQE